MGYSSIDEVIRERGAFPTEADPSSWLGALVCSFDALGRVREGKGITQVTQKTFNDFLQHPIHLLRYTDNPGFYQIKDDYPEGVCGTSNSLPFRADNDQDAVGKLIVEIADVHKKISVNLFCYGGMEDAVYDEDYPRKLVRMAETSKFAKVIANEGWQRYNVG